MLRNEARNYHRNKKRLLDREKSFSVLSLEELGQLTSVDHYPSEEFVFSSYGCDLHLDNELVANGESPAMLSDDRPTDPARLPIFSKKEHFMGNAFGMIPGLEPDEWSNDACRGYVIMAMEDCGFSKKDIRRVVGQLYEVFDLNSVEDAKEKYLSSPY